MKEENQENGKREDKYHDADKTGACKKRGSSRDEKTNKSRETTPQKNINLFRKSERKVIAAMDMSKNIGIIGHPMGER
jgi:hypothetical protein